MALSWDIQSALPGALWPAVPQPGAAALLALQYQFEHTQWLSAEALAALQLAQLNLIVAHAFETVPHYRERWANLYNPAVPLTWAAFARLPPLTRADLQTRFEAMKSARVPGQHGAVVEARTSGSTGTPVCVLKTELCGLFWNAFTLRDHAWHCRDLGGKLAAIRQGVAREEGESWGAATQGTLRTGRAATLPVSTEISAQLKWLQEQNPDYLLTHPSNLAALARLAIERGVRLPLLREVRTSGEILSPEVREMCHSAWGVSVADMYSSNEVGYIALQCPDAEHYHVMAEGLVVEVLDKAGLPCRPGEVGRLVVTALHNFATPLIRYEIGDYAEAGEPCSCGRGLPVLSRVIGRVRNMLVLANGGRIWPSFSVRALSESLPVTQYQFVQKEINLIEARLVVAAPLSRVQENQLVEHVGARLPDGIRIEIVYCEAIDRNAGGKFEDFICAID